MRKIAVFLCTMFVLIGGTVSVNAAFDDGVKNRIQQEAEPDFIFGDGTDTNEVVYAEKEETDEPETRDDSNTQFELTEGWNFDPLTGKWLFGLLNPETGVIEPLRGQQILGEKQTQYCFDANGFLVVGFQTTDKGIVYYQERGETPQDGLGALMTKGGWQTIGDSVYYFGDKTSYSVTTGWKTIGSYKYYLDPKKKGALATGFYRIGSRDFYFTETGKPGTSGRLKTGWITVGSNNYYGAKSGKTGEKGTLYAGLKKVGKEVYYFKSSGNPGTRGKIITGELKVKDNEYYFKKTGAPGTKGMGVTGWLNLKRGRCYCSNGKILKNQYVDDYYVGKNGAMSKKSKQLYDVVWKTINAKTTSKMSKSQKLRACYNYLVSPEFRYLRKRQFQNTPSWKMDYAYEMLTTKSGICYNYASAFGFIAKELGYDAKMIPGGLMSLRGAYQVHAWVEITMSGTAYVFDASMEHGTHRDFYKKTYKQTGREYVKP